MPDPDFTITARDLQANGFCARGSRRWFEEHGLDYRAFLKDGITASALLATGDGMAEEAVKLCGVNRG